MNKKLQKKILAADPFHRNLEKKRRALRVALNGDDTVYLPATIIEGDRALATHCETFLLYGEMKHEDRMTRITQSIADYRETHTARARKGQRP